MKMTNFKHCDSAICSRCLRTIYWYGEGKNEPIMNQKKSIETFDHWHKIGIEI